MESINQISLVLKIKSSLCSLRAFSILVLFFCLSEASAQTWNEIFNQKKTQIKYLTQQIAALQIYIGYAKKGYEIAGSGITSIKDIKNGEFNLHTSFIKSLKTVNPNLTKDNSKIADIISFQSSINKSFAHIKNLQLLTSNQRDYINNVKDLIEKQCDKDLEELLLVITSGKVEMKDDERIERLDKVFESMRDKSAFAQSFCNDVIMLAKEIEDVQNDAITGGKLNGITL